MFKSKKKILFIQVVSKGGGAEKTLKNLLVHLENRNEGHFIKILSKDHFIKKRNFYNKIIREFLFIKKIRNESKNFEAIISSVEGLPFLYLFFATIGVRVKKILWLHCEPKNYSKYLKIKDKIILWLSIFLCNRMLCASPYSAIQFEKKKKSLFLPNFVEYNKILHLTNRIPNFSENSLNILFVGSLANLKRPKLVYDLALKAAKYKNKIEVHYYGDGPLLNDLIKYVENNFKLNVTYKFHGYQKINWNDFPFNSILIQPSFTEAMPMIFLEAINAKIPILTNNFLGSDFFQNEGLVFHSDFNQLDLTMNQLLYISNLSQIDLKTRLNNSLDLIQKEFNNDNNISKLFNFLKN